VISEFEYLSKFEITDKNTLGCETGARGGGGVGWIHDGQTEVKYSLRLSLKDNLFLILKVPPSWIRKECFAAI
jgi:hypothetical protein